MAYGYFKGLPRKIIVNKILRDKAFNIAKKENCKYDGYQHGLAAMAYELFDEKTFLFEKTFGGAVKIGPNKELAK